MEPGSSVVDQLRLAGRKAAASAPWSSDLRERTRLVMDYSFLWAWPTFRRADL
jgi:hypothetical protein